MKPLKIKVNKEIPGYNIGQTVNVETDINGIPVDKFWRDRLVDATTDNCVEIVIEKSTKEKSE